MRKITQQHFGYAQSSEIIETTMCNRHGMQVSSCTYGATITKIMTANREGKLENIVCSFPTVEGYIENPQFFGATIGPFAGRLENAVLQVGDKQHTVFPNEGPNLLHGGSDGFHQAIWQVHTMENTNSVSTIYELDYQGNYVGHIKMTVTMTLYDTNELTIHYEGTSTEDTLLNCTNHTYFNLSGNLKRPIHRHQLKLSADCFIPINDQALPLGEYRSVKGTPFDFNNSEPLIQSIQADNTQIHFASQGLDHPFVLTNKELLLVDEESGRKMTIITDDAAVVVYTGNKIGDDFNFTEARAANHLGVCLEVQNFPNSSKYPLFPSSLLRKGERYEKTTIYKFHC